MKIALQLYSVRNDLERDVEKTLERIKSTGIQAVEVAPLPPGISPRLLAKRLKEFELEVAAMHCELPRGDNAGPILDATRELSCGNLIWHGWPRDSRFDSLKGVETLAAECNDANAAARAQGMQFGLHNHWWEFETIDGKYLYRVLVENLSPEIFLEIDVYWAQTAGMNPTAIIRELEARTSFLHLKDGPAIQGQPMQALGQGVLDFPTIIQASSKADWGVIEFDECATDIWEAVRQSCEYLSKFVPRPLRSCGL